LDGWEHISPWLDQCWYLHFLLDHLVLQPLSLLSEHLDRSLEGFGLPLFCTYFGGLSYRVVAEGDWHLVDQAAISNAFPLPLSA
jgi:hypothetical protein